MRKFTWEALVEHLPATASASSRHARRPAASTPSSSRAISSCWKPPTTTNSSWRLFRSSSWRHHPTGRLRFRPTRPSATCSASSARSPYSPVQRGGFYDCDITACDPQLGRVSATPQLSIEPSLSINDIEIFRTVISPNTLLRARTDFAFSPQDVRERAVFRTARRRTASAATCASGGVRSRQRALRRLQSHDPLIPSAPGYPASKNRAFAVPTTGSLGRSQHAHPVLRHRVCPAGSR